MCCGTGLFAVLAEDLCKWRRCVTPLRFQLMFGVEMCRPIFVDGEQPVLILQDSRHPTMEALCVMPHFPAVNNLGRFGNFVPNDIVLGGPKPSTMLLTGPNMGGKSTLLRQVCIWIRRCSLTV